MKTTFDIPEPLLRDVHRLARERGSTAKDLVVGALSKLVAEQDSPTVFALDDASVSGKGVRPEFVGAPWASVREAAYGLDVDL